MLKKPEQLDILDEETEDVCVRGLIDYYEQRPEELDDACLADFASMYEVTKHQPSSKKALSTHRGISFFNIYVKIWKRTFITNIVFSF